MNATPAGKRLCVSVLADLVIADSFRYHSTAMTIRCALYARQSKEEHQAASIEVQLEEAQRYVAAKGWSLAREHIFIDDSISRAEFKKRPALFAMLNAAGARSFDVVIVRDESRLGGDTTRTSLLIQDLLDGGVKLFYYFSDEQVVIDGAVSKFMVTVRNFAAEVEREKLRNGRTSTC